MGLISLEWGSPGRAHESQMGLTSTKVGLQMGLTSLNWSSKWYSQAQKRLMRVLIGAPDGADKPQVGSKWGSQASSGTHESLRWCSL